MLYSRSRVILFLLTFLHSNLFASSVDDENTSSFIKEELWSVVATNALSSIYFPDLEVGEAGFGFGLGSSISNIGAGTKICFRLDSNIYFSIAVAIGIKNFGKNYTAIFTSGIGISI